MEQSLEFTEHARILLISVLFILLTARMEVSDLTGLPTAAAAFVAIVILVARPLSVVLATSGSGLKGNEKVFLAAMAPRGVVAAAVSSLFALELVEMGYEDAALLMPVTFAVIATTVLVSGLLAVPLVQRLGLAQSKPQGVLIVGAGKVGRILGQALRRHDVRVLVVDSDGAKVDEARRLGLPSRRGEILSRRVLRELNLDGIGQFVALTPNDDVNTLAAAHFRRLFGEKRVFQIRPSTNLGGPLPEYASDLQAPSLGAGATLDKLEALAKAGGATREVELEGGTTIDDVRGECGADATPLFVVDDEGNVDFVEADDSLPNSGTLVVLSPP